MNPERQKPLWWPAPFEIAAYVWCLVAYLLLQRLPIQYPILETLKQSITSFWRFILLALGTGLAAVFLQVVRTGKDARNWRAALRNSPASDLKHWVWILRMLVAIILAGMFHFLLKSSVYLINPRNWDRELLALDRTLHFGISPSIFFVELFGNPVFCRFMDVFYSSFYGLIVIVYPPVILSIASRKVGETLASGIIFLLITGWLGYVALPSWGPVFVQPQEFESTLEHMPFTVRVQTQIYEETVSIIRNPQARRSIRFGGIAAFPSLHLATMFLYALVSRALSKRWFRINMIFVGFMFVGSLITGYHYMVDSYAGLLLGWLVFKAGTVLAAFSSPESKEEPNPAGEPVSIQ